MVQILPEIQSKSGRLADLLAPTVGQGLGEMYANYSANKALDRVINNKELQAAPESKRLEALQTALNPYGQVGQNLLQKRMQVEQKEIQERRQKILARVASGEELAPEEEAALDTNTQLEVLKLKKNKKTARSVYESLINAGYPEETAKIWQSQMENAPTGGQTDVIAQVNKLLLRSQSGKGRVEGDEEITSAAPTLDIEGISDEPVPLEFPPLPEPLGLTPADIVKQNEYREKINIPAYTEAVDRLDALDDEYRELMHLQDLNEIPGALPSGLGLWNVNPKTGELLLKGASSRAAQDYNKTVARMARRASEYFPGRVTNFDLFIFKEGLPSLANNYEGRKIITSQLILGNRIANLKEETFKAAMDHYGSGADPVLVKRYAAENYKRLKSKLESDYRELNRKAYENIEKNKEVSSKSSSSDMQRPPLKDFFVGGM